MSRVAPLGKRDLKAGPPPNDRKRSDPLLGYKYPPIVLKLKPDASLSIRSTGFKSPNEGKELKMKVRKFETPQLQSGGNSEFRIPNSEFFLQFCRLDTQESPFPA